MPISLRTRGWKLSRRALAVTWMLFVLLAANAGASLLPQTTGTFRPEKTYNFTNFDQINTFNGGLTLQIPLGIRYRSGAMEYGLTLTFNSSKWQSASAAPQCGDDCTHDSRLGPWQNAGAGWSVSLGALLPPADDFPQWNRTGDYLYVDALGGEHTLFPTLHHFDADDDGDESGQKHLYSRDGSFIRVKKSAVSNPLTVTVEFPDGSRHAYNRDPGSGWTSATAPWRPARIEDAYGSGVSITYTSTLWTLTDDYGRTQYVHFSTETPPATAAMPAVVTSVEMLSTTSARSVWTFSYDTKTLTKPWAPGLPSAYLDAPVLTQLTLPDDSTYRFPLAVYTATGNPQTVELPTGGQIQYDWGALSPPGIIRPSMECASQASALWAPESTTNDAVLRRTVVDPSTARRAAAVATVDSGTTQYCWFVPTQLPPGEPPNCYAGDEFEELHQVTIAPDGTRTDHYFSVFNAVPIAFYRPSLWGTMLHEYGRPYVRDPSRDDPWDTGAYLSTETRKWLPTTLPPSVSATCEGMNPADWELVRRTYVVYDNDANPTEDVVDPQAAVFHTNPRLQRQRTVYLDDCSDTNTPSTCAWTEDAYFDFDHFGHFRQKIQTSSFSDGTREEFTDVNWGAPPRRPVDDPWVLGTYTLHTVDETAVATCNAAAPGSWAPPVTQTLREEACFDPDTGFLKATRVRSEPWGVSPSVTDLVHHYVDTDATPDGLVDEEAWYGGDLNPAPTTDPLCDVVFAPFTPAYRQAHSYSRGVRTSTQWLDASGAPFGPPLLRQEVDANTGLPEVHHDPADPGNTLQTVLSYDEMFRLQSLQPSAGLGLASEHYAYLRPGLSASGRFEVTQKLCGNGATDCSGSAVLGERRFELDGFGRVHRDWQRYGLGSSEWDSRFSWYDSEGRRIYASEWGRDSQTADYGTEFHYDFAGRLVQTDHEVPGNPQFDVTTWDYLGMRQTVRTVGVGTAIAGNGVTQQQVTTRETYDGFGRLVQVEEPSGDSLTSLVPTSYHYDVGSRLIGSLTAPSDGTPIQQRCWEYDDRGLLESERHPELGASGQGTTAYSRYDALGNAREKDTGAHVVSFVFDRANRLQKVSEGPLDEPTRTLKDFSYAIDNAEGNWRLGKVQVANAWNYLPTGPGTEAETRLEETFVYGGVGGRKSERTLRFFLGAGALEAFHAPQQNLQVFHHAESHDALGQRVSLSYPQCVLGTRECLDAGDQLPVRSQSWVYELGRLRNVPGWTMPPDTQPGVVYHPGGMWAEIRHANGVTDVQAQDGSRRLRPGSLSTVRGSELLWKPGLFSYDAAGNILSIGPSEDGGTDLFAYDGASRLRESRFFVQQRNPLDSALLVDSFETGDTSLWNRTQHWEASTLLGYVFDEHGNLLKERRNNVDFRTHATNGATNRLTTGASYDAAGNLTLFDNVTTTFDALNRVVKRQAAGGTPLYFLYTADDERTVTYEPDGQSVWLRFTLRDFDGRLIRKVNETTSSTLLADEDFIFLGDQPLAKVGSADLLVGVHLSLDHLGSVRTTTNGGGAVVARKKFYPFGEEATPFFEQAAIALKYTGHERDAYDPAATGDDRDYMHARFHSPLTGRMLSVDPVIGSLNAPQSWNRYAYVTGNPLRYTDPTGELPASALAEIAQRYFGELREGAMSALSTGSLAGVIAATLAGSALDAASAVVEPLRAGEAVGTAIGSGAGAGETALAVGQDALRTAGLVAPLAGAGRAVAGEALLGSIPTAAAPVGRLGAPLSGSFRNAPATIMSRRYTGHALDSMQGRGFTPSVVENTIQGGQRLAGNTRATSRFWDAQNNISVIVDTNSGRVVTVRSGN